MVTVAVTVTASLQDFAKKTAVTVTVPVMLQPSSSSQTKKKAATTETVTVTSSRSRLWCALLLLLDRRPLSETGTFFLKRPPRTPTKIALLHPLRFG